MTHFNHDWDTTKIPAVPVSVGDRYYAQDLNDDFNYLKHLPYEVFLQGRTRGVMITPNDTWDNNTNSLTLSGGFGVVLQDCIELDPDEDFVIPPKTYPSPRYERIPFIDATLVLPNDSAVHYIVATPTKRSLLQRTKALLTERYASRIRYDGIITVQDTTPTAEQILIGLCHNKEYCLLIDNNPDQCKDNIILKKWFGQNKITQDFISALWSYYNTSIASIKTEITINTVNSEYGIITNGTFNNCDITIDTVSNSGFGIGNGTFNNCNITIDTVSNNGVGIGSSTFNNCNITINTANSGFGIVSGTFNNCDITIDTVSNSGFGIGNSTFNNCNITINTANSGTSIISGTFNNCNITINTVSNNGVGIGNGTFNNCNITIDTANNSGFGIVGGTFNNCDITIDTVSNSGVGINDDGSIYLYLTKITCSAITNLNNTAGKLNVLNDTILHAS